MASMFAKSSGAPAGVMQPSQPPQIERYEPEEEKPKQPKKVSFAQFDRSCPFQVMCKLDIIEMVSISKGPAFRKEYEDASC